MESFPQNEPAPVNNAAFQLFYTILFYNKSRSYPILSKTRKAFPEKFFGPLRQKIFSCVRSLPSSDSKWLKRKAEKLLIDN
jgi:hypothetical protein